ncbi:MAG TPA: class I SAM-dependent methyltransferase [Luteimonas sp.]|nr:class I SAM-dependent methyltransferase [Luteimonas sp.]
MHRATLPAVVLALLVASAGCTPRPTAATIGAPSRADDHPSASAAADAADTGAVGYRQVPASADGIGRTYFGREIASVMGWQGAGWLEREEREREERGSVLLRELDVRPGMQVADIGAGTGWHARRLAPLVGPGGKVFAVDVQPQMVERLEALAATPGFDNVVPVLGGERDPALAAGSIDLALMVDVYHELAWPSEMLDALARALRPGGRLVLVEYRGEDDGVPIKPLHRMTEAQVRREVERPGLVWERTGRSLPWQHVVVFRKVAPPGQATRR